MDMVTFKVYLEEDEDGIFVVTVPSLPGCVSQGKSKQEALENIKEAIELHIKALAENGEQIAPIGVEILNVAVDL